MFDFLYSQKNRCMVEAFGDSYSPEGQFSHGANIVVVRVAKNPEDGDGHPCIVRESRLPAVFYQIEVLPSPDSVGEERQGIFLSTGSAGGDGATEAWVAKTVEMFSQGMLGVSQKRD